MDSFAVRNVGTNLTRRKLKGHVFSVKNDSGFGHLTRGTPNFVARNAEMIQCGIMYQVFVENVARNLIYPEAISIEEEVIFVHTGVILHIVAPRP